MQQGLKEGLSSKHLIRKSQSHLLRDPLNIKFYARQRNYIIRCIIPPHISCPKSKVVFNKYNCIHSKLVKWHIVFVSASDKYWTWDKHFETTLGHAILVPCMCRCVHILSYSFASMLHVFRQYQWFLNCPISYVSTFSFLAIFSLNNLYKQVHLFLTFFTWTLWTSLLLQLIWLFFQVLYFSLFNL